MKNSVKSAIKFINNFETTVCDIAAENNYDLVICGHIHHPEIKNVQTKHGDVTYMNSGDWIENLTALEYNDSGWTLYKYAEDLVAQSVNIDNKGKNKESARQMMLTLMQEMNVKGNTPEAA